MEWRNRRRS